MEKEPLEKLLMNLVALPNENETVEFKVNNASHEEIGRRISALSNSSNLHDKKCAYMAFGIEDIGHDVVGTNFFPSRERIGNDQFEFWLSQHLNPRIDFIIHEFQHEQKNVVIIEIPPAISQPVKFNNIAYIRVGSATPKLNDYPEKESKIWNNINKRKAKISNTFIE